MNRPGITSKGVGAQSVRGDENFRLIEDKPTSAREFRDDDAGYVAWLD